jgi:hypothetical protein
MRMPPHNQGSVGPVAAPHLSAHHSHHGSRLGQMRHNNNDLGLVVNNDDDEEANAFDSGNPNIHYLSGQGVGIGGLGMNYDEESQQNDN